MNLQFKKEEDESWYVVFDNYIGDKADLQMVAGADSLCDILSHNKSTLEVSLTDTLTPYTSVILHKWLPFDYENGIKEYVGANYRADFENPKMQSFDLWICPVTLLILGEYPSVIYIQYTN